MINITKAQLIALQPCEPEMCLALWGDAESLNIEQALDRGYAVSDILWVAAELGLKRQCVIFGVRCARLVLHLNPDPRVRAAIDAAQTWLDNPSPAAAHAARAAARAARATARAVDAADAADDGAYATARAVDAAYAAANAAYAAADAVYAAYAAAYAAYAAAYAADGADDVANAYAAYAAAYATYGADADAAIKAILIDVFSQQSVD